MIGPAYGGLAEMVLRRGPLPARSASDVLLRSIDLTVAVEKLGADATYFRVHHFAQQLALPFPLLAAVGARSKSAPA